MDPACLFDEGRRRWPRRKKLTCSYPGIKFAYGPDEFLGNDVTVLEMDVFDNLLELIYAESPPVQHVHGSYGSSRSR